jgi:low temperature requirement protein LtrA
MNGRPPWRRPPRLRTLEAPEELRATWLELFFDLVFVVAVTQIANELSRDTSAEGFLRFAGLFVPALWAWVGFTFYDNRFDSDDVVYRLMKLAAMLGIAVLAGNVHNATTAHGSVGFALSYVAVRAVLLAMYWRVRRHVEDPGRQLVTLYLAGFGAGASLWLVSLAVPTPARFAFWAAGLAIDIAMPLLGWRTIRRAPVNVPHISERFGLFFIIVLGEAIFGVVTGTSGLAFGLRAALVAGASFVVAACMWWLYFDFADTSVIGRGMLGLVFMYGHVVLLAGVAAAGVGTKLAIREATAGGLAAGTRWALCGGVAAYLLSLSVFHLTAEWTTPRDRVLLARVAIAALLVVLAVAGGGVAPAALLAIVAAALVFLLVREARSFPEGAASVWEPPEPSSG